MVDVKSPKRIEIVIYEDRTGAHCIEAAMMGKKEKKVERVPLTMRTPLSNCWTMVVIEKNDQGGRGRRC